MAGNKEEEEWRHHLRIVREVVPSGEKAGREENNQKKEETCGKSDVSGGQNASVRVRRGAGPSGRGRRSFPSVSAGPGSVPSAVNSASNRRRRRRSPARNGRPSTSAGTLSLRMAGALRSAAILAGKPIIVERVQTEFGLEPEPPLGK